MKTQQALLIQEYERLGKPLEPSGATVESIVRGVDLKLSANQNWVIQSDKGPSGETQFLSNLKISVWIPASLKLESRIVFDDDKIPMVVEQTAQKTRHYCVDILHHYFHSTAQPSVAPPPSAPLPGQGTKPLKALPPPRKPEVPAASLGSAMMSGMAEKGALN